MSSPPSLHPNKLMFDQYMLLIIIFIYTDCDLYFGKDEQYGDRIQSMGLNDTLDLNYPGSLPTIVDEVVHQESSSLEQNNVRRVTTQPPPPPAYFTGYTLPPGNPCENFALPPPPADKKRTGPRRKLLF